MSFTPPCHCEGKQGIRDNEWKEYKGQLGLIAWQDLHDKIAQSEYIKYKWGKCWPCTVYARRRVAILMIFLSKLGVLTDNGMGEKVDKLDLT